MTSIEAISSSVAGASAAITALDLTTLSGEQLLATLASLERCRRRIEAAIVSTVDQCDRHQLGRADGFLSTRTLITHAGNLAGATASRRVRVGRALRDLPAVAEAYAAGNIGDDQVQRLARLWANPRVRDQLLAFEHTLLAYAIEHPYKWFKILADEWERRADDDGPTPAAAREDVRLTRNGDGTWNLSGLLSEACGVALEEVFAHYVQSEEAADWEAARAEQGDAATWATLGRTDAQRRCAAFTAIFFDAASRPPGSREPRFLVNLMMTWEQFCAEMEDLAGREGVEVPADADPEADPPPAPPSSPPTPPPPVPSPILAGYGRPFGQTSSLDRCSTFEGTPVHPRVAARLGVGAELRRVVFGADSAVIDLGRRARCFAGSAREAVMLRHPECVWVGCEQPLRRCQADHLQPHSRHGPTDARNGSPLCGAHNRLKSTGFTTWCDSNGTWHTVRPDGTEIGPRRE